MNPRVCGAAARNVPDHQHRDVREGPGANMLEEAELMRYGDIVESRGR